MIKNIKAFFLYISRKSTTFAPQFKKFTAMTKKKTELEQALSNFKKTQKEQRQIVQSLETIIRSKEREVVRLKNEKQSLIDEYEDKLMSVVGENADEYIKGYNFERHVAWWMREHFPQYSLKMWQGDKYYCPYVDDKQITAEWNAFPDLIFVDEEKKKVLAIECKYRKDGKLTIDEKQFHNYRQSQIPLQTLFDAEVKVVVMAGVNEFSITPQRPDYMYCIPIDCFEDGKEKDLKLLKEYLVMNRNSLTTKPILENILF